MTTNDDAEDHLQVFLSVLDGEVTAKIANMRHAVTEGDRAEQRQMGPHTVSDSRDEKRADRERGARGRQRRSVQESIRCVQLWTAFVVDGRTRRHI